MTGGDLRGLGELRIKRGAGIVIGALTFLVSIMIFFTEPSLSAKPVEHVSVQMSVTMFCIFMMYTSMSDAGCRAGEERPEYAEAHRLLKFIHYFVPVPDNEIPPTSLLREFLGGSSFKY